VRLACEDINAASPQDLERVLARIRGNFDFPVVLTAFEELPLQERVRLSRGAQVVLLVVGDELLLAGPVENHGQVLLFGPLPRLVGPSNWNRILSLVTVLLLAAAAIVVLLRPIHRRLRQLERAAISLSSGNLDTRVVEDPRSPLHSVATAINGLAQQTQSLLKTQQELMQAVSHEMKTPLSRLHFAIDLLESESDPQKIQERLEVMRTAADEMDEMVDSLLQYVRSDHPRRNSPRWRVPLEPIVSDVFSAEQMLHPQLQFELDPRVVSEDICVLSNANDLTCVLANTVRNATRFAKTIIRVSAYQTTKGVVMDIDDDGPGIPTHLQSKVFQPFERLGDDGGSAGLGLALVKRILKQHGGWAKTETNAMGGCRIRTYWPRRST
jgi:two-component system sensor histidine kinase RstB